MSKTNQQSATSADDPARAAHLKLLEAQRKKARRALLKRRRRKSGQ